MAQPSKSSKVTLNRGPKIATPPKTGKSGGGRSEAIHLTESLAEILTESGALEGRIDFHDHSIRIRKRNDVAESRQATRKVNDNVVNSQGDDSRDAQDEFVTPVTSQHVGTYRSTHVKTQQPMVKNGDSVDLNQCLGWVEVMGIRHEVLAPRAGVVAEVLVSDSDPIEFGQVLHLLQ
jgi:acetyl-CoA carboxylase biotin carboxyl carrier protein